MTSPEEEQKRAAEAKARESAKPEKPNTPTGDAFTLVGQLVGDAKNLAVDALAGQHSGDKVLSGITPQLAAQYQRGKEIQERLASGAVKPSQLNDSDKKNLDAFNNVRKSIERVPLYDRDSLMRYVEKGIEQKAAKTPLEAAKAPSHEARKPTVHEVSKPASPDVKTTGREAAKLNAPDVTKPALHDASKPSPEQGKAVAAKDLAEKSPAHPGGIGAHGVSPVEREIQQMLPARREVSTANISPPDVHVAKNAPAKAQDVPAGNFAPALGKIAESAGGDRNPDKGERKTPETSVVISKNFETVPYKSSNSQNSVETRSPAVNTFERRTGYDAGVKIEVKTQEKQLARDELGQENSKSGQQFLPRATTSFENMRRVLEERSAIESNRNLNEKFTAPVKDQKRKENIEFAPPPGDSAKRLTLSEIAKVLPLHRLDRIIQYSHERFSSGLRWQNNLRHPDAAPKLRTHLQSGDSQPPRAVQKTDLPPQSRLSHSSQAGLRAMPESGLTGKIFQGGQSGAVREPAPAGGVKTYSLPGRIQDRYITGAEIALAAIIAAAGAKRLRYDELNPSAPESKEQIPKVQKIEAFSPGLLKQDRSPNRQTSQVDNRTVISCSSKIDSTFLANVAPGDTRGASQNSPAKSAPAEPESAKFTPSQKRFITGAEIALAAVIASCGSARIRQTFAEKTDPEDLSRDDQWRIGSASPKDFESASRETEESKTRQEDESPGTLRYVQKHKYNRTTRLIGPQETFVSIAESLPCLFCDGRYGWLIADINLPRIKESFVDGKRIVEVRSRQLIEIPCMADIVAFNRNRKEEQKPENLITVVIENQVDREMLNEHFGVFVEGGGKPAIAAVGGTVTPPILSGNFFAADAADVLPPLVLQSQSVLRIARRELIDIARQIMDAGRKPIAKFRNSLNRDRIKRKF